MSIGTIGSLDVPLYTDKAYHVGATIIYVFRSSFLQSSLILQNPEAALESQAIMRKIVDMTSQDSIWRRHSAHSNGSVLLIA